VRSRIGFVANSSSMNYIISQGAYSSVFKLAIAIINLRDYGKWDKELIKEIKSSNLNINTPVCFGNTNYDTFIAKQEDGDYIVNSCKDHYFETDGIIESGDSDDGCEIPDISESYHFWFPEYEVSGKLYRNQDGNVEYCNKHNCRELIVTKRGKIICPHCYWLENVKFQKMTVAAKIKLIKKGLKELSKEFLINLLETEKSIDIWRELDKRLEEEE